MPLGIAPGTRLEGNRDQLRIFFERRNTEANLDLVQSAEKKQCYKGKALPFKIFPILSMLIF